ncbi:hypothetical protein [Gemmatimonas sp.]|uniref:hypothetical protein n=1 Tax=Gemmatimonas sp. TaxID=1962908 RepID=UPI00286E7A37|nr:hypothetical protein [Gemmatimonas sp.]
MSQDPSEPIRAILLREAQIRKLRRQPSFIAMLCLARATNTIRFIVDAIMVDSRGDSVSAVRARYSGGILLAGATCEALSTAVRVQKNIDMFAGADRLADLVRYPLVVRLRQQNGFFGRVRNQTAFHFNERETRESLSREHPDPCILALDDDDCWGAFYPLIDLGVSLRNDADHTPTRAELTQFLIDFPALGSIGIPKENASNPEVERYAMCMMGSLNVAVAFCDIVSELMRAALGEWGARAGVPDDEGSISGRRGKLL